MISITHSAKDAPLAARIADDLRAAGYAVAERVQPGRDHLLIVLVSPDAENDTALLREVEAAHDEGQRVVPVLTAPTELPSLLNHLEPVDATKGYDAGALRERIEAELTPGARLPLRVRTTKVRRSNTRALLVLSALAVIIFVISTYYIAIGVIRPPQDEYNAIDTQVAETRDFLIGPTMEFLSTALPRSTEQAAEFPATLEAVQTRVRPFFAQTATAVDVLLEEFEIAPTPEATEE